METKDTTIPWDRREQQDSLDACALLVRSAVISKGLRSVQRMFFFICINTKLKDIYKETATMWLQTKS